MKVAVKEISAADGEIVKAENKLASIQEEIGQKKVALEGLQTEINKKTTDFEIYISSRQTELSRERAALVSDKEKLAQDRAEFQEILTKHKEDKKAVEDQKRDYDLQALRHSAKMQAITEFITAIKRAYNVLPE